MRFLWPLLAAGSGAGRWFAQPCVSRGGHRAIQPAEVLRGSGQLREWRRTGRRPAGGPLR